MAITKITADVIDTGTITADNLHATLDLSSKTLTLPTAQTATTQSAGDNSTKVATTAYVETATAALVDSAPGTLNTLNELAAALGDDANFSTTVTNSIATKLPLAGGTLTGALTLTADANPALEISRGSANTTNVNLKYNTTLTGQLSAANAEFQISAAGSSTPMEFFTNGSERMRIDSSGNVGIGTSSPQDTLHVVTDSSTTNDTVDVVRIEATSSGTPAVGFGAVIDFRAERAGASSDSMGRVGFVADTMTASRIDGAYVVETAIDGTYSERMRIDSLGNVKIGNTGGSGILNVNNGANDGGYVHFANNVGSTTLTNDQGLAFGWNKSNGGGESIIIANQGAGSTGGLAFATNTSGGSYNERMRISSSGNVAIGNTTSPSAKLHLYTSGSEGINLGIQNSERYYNIETDGGNLMFKDVSAGGLARMTITSAGHVGIMETPSGEAAAAHVLRIGDKITISEYDDGSNPEQFNLLHNSSSSETYRETGYATNIQQRNGDITFKTAASGTAGAAITFNDRAKILNNGQVLINATNANYPTDYATEGSVATTIIRGPETAASDNALFVYGGRIALNAHPARYATRAYIQSDGGGMKIWHTDNSDMIFAVNNSEKVRIQYSDGIIKCFGIYAHATSGTVRDVYIEDGGQLGYSSSVRAHKTNITDYSDASWLYNLNPKQFNRRKKNMVIETNDDGVDHTVHDGTYSDTEFHTPIEVGFLAEDVEALDSKLCFYDVVTDEDGNESEQLAGIHYKNMVAPMLKLIQEQKTLIDDLTTRIEVLEG